MAYAPSDISAITDYLLKYWQALQGQSHNILNAWNTEGAPGIADQYFTAAQQSAGPGPFQATGAHLDPALKTDNAFKSAVWNQLAPQVGGGSDVFGHIIENLLGQYSGPSYDPNRGWPMPGGGYTGDAGLIAGGFDPNHLPAWYHAGGGTAAPGAPPSAPPAAPPVGTAPGGSPAPYAPIQTPPQAFSPPYKIRRPRPRIPPTTYFGPH